MKNRIEGMNNHQSISPEEGQEGADGSYLELKEFVMKYLAEIYEWDEENFSEDAKEAYERYGRYLTNATITSIEAAEKFKGLIPNSLNKPDKPYQQTHKFHAIVDFEGEKLELAKKLDKLLEFKG
jgi:hypothetical protein